MSNKVAEKVSKMIEPFFVAGNELSHFELVDVEYKKEGSNWFLRIFIDRDGGVTLDDCQFVSQQLEHLLDEQDPIPTSYFLEVSSPGVERPLKKKEDYDRFSGRLIKVKTYAPIAGKKEHTGYLCGLVDEQVVLQLDGVELSIPLAQVAAANLTLET